MATDSSHRVIMGKILSTLWRLHILQVRRTTIIKRTSSIFGNIEPRTAELAALERLEKSSYTSNGEMLSTL